MFAPATHSTIEDNGVLCNKNTILIIQLCFMHLKVKGRKFT